VSGVRLRRRRTGHRGAGFLRHLRAGRLFSVRCTSQARVTFTVETVHEESIVVIVVAAAAVVIVSGLWGMLDVAGYLVTLVMLAV